MSPRLNRARLWRHGAIAAVIAAIANLVILGIGRAAGVSFVVPMLGGATGPVSLPVVVVTTAIWFAVGLLVTMVVAARQPRRLRGMQIAAIAITVVSLVQPLTVDADTATRLMLAIMHPVTGAAFVLALRRTQAEPEIARGDASQPASATPGA